MWAHYQACERRLTFHSGKWRRKLVLDVIIRPMSFASFLQLPAASKRLFDKPDFNLQSIKHLLPLFTNGVMEEGLVEKLDYLCLMQIWKAVNDLNDFDFIKSRVEEEAEAGDEGKKATPGEILAGIAHFFPAYTIEGIMALPAQTVLALVNDLKPEEKGEDYDDGSWSTMSSNDIKKFMKRTAPKNA